MNSKVKIVLNRANVRKQLLQSSEMQQIVNNYAFSAQAKLGDGYEVSYRKGKNRVNAQIRAVNMKSINAASKRSPLEFLGISLPTSRENVCPILCIRMMT